MKKPTGTAFDKIASVVLSVVFLSVFTAYAQASWVEEIAIIKEDEKQSISKIEAEIEKQKAKIAELQLKKFSVQKTPFTDVELAQLLSAVGLRVKPWKQRGL